MSSSTPANNDKDKDKDKDLMLLQTSLAPSHILQDGRFVFLPPPSALEQRRFVEHAIGGARGGHGLLQQDMKEMEMMLMDTTTTKQEEEEEGDDDDDEDDEEEKTEQQTKQTTTTQQMKIHPLALASARLQNEGINELNRAINLATLVNTGEYFGMSNE
jgi:hypothetical protein